MESFLTLVAPLSDAAGLPMVTTALLSLIALGVSGHFGIRYAVKRLTAVADTTATRWDDVVFYSISPPIQWAMWIAIIYGLLSLFEEAQGLRNALVHVADAGLILLVGWLLHRVSTGVENELLSEHRGPRNSDDRATISAVARLARITVWVLSLLMVLQSQGVSVSGLLAFGGVGGIAVGFAAKDLLANFLGGLSIYLDRPFAVGDWIRSPDRQIEGTVEDIGLRMTRIRTFDQRPLYVPNSTFSSVSLENPSRMTNRRIYETIGVRYEDASRVAAIVKDVMAMFRSHDDIAQDRTLIVNFNHMGPSSLDFFVYAFTKTTNWVEYHAIKEDVLLRILAIVEDNGAEIAFPTHTIHQVLPEPADT
ncbi:mechanosensitive ion channel family protein [Luminiphilus sp.]|nr:mechanosensitive ion channel family protein [Luminiphilus sp.]